MADERRQLLKVDLPSAEVTLDADPVRLAQVLSNLPVNASKYSSEGSPIELRASVEKDVLCIDFQDHGIGLDAAELKHLFTMFKQMSTSTEYLHRGLAWAWPCASR